jgi:hypothetical protein
MKGKFIKKNGSTYLKSTPKPVLSKKSSKKKKIGIALGVIILGILAIYLGMF